jgi:hypothetical protein
MGRLLEGIKKLLGSDQGQGLQNTGVAGRVPVDFGSFLLAPIPSIGATRFASGEAIEKYADTLAISFRQALRERQMDRLAIYLPQQTSTSWQRVMEEDQLQKLEDTCNQKLFPTGPGQTNVRRRVFIIKHRLEFNPLFDELLRDSVILRPLRDSDVLVSPDAEDTERTLIQYLIGVLEIWRSGQKLEKQPIWAYQVPAKGTHIRVSADFDLMVKGFPREAHAFPLGLEINCSLREKGGTRTLDSVSFDFAEATHWLSNTKGLSYMINSGNPNGVVTSVALAEYVRGARSETLVVKRLPPGESGWYELVPGHKLKIDRVQSIDIGPADGVATTYLFGFFSTAHSYDPKRNVLRMIAQLLPRGGGDVYFAPGHKDSSQVAFSLTPATTGTGFLLRAPLGEYTLEKISPDGSRTAVTPEDQCDVNVGDVIVATHNQFRTALHTFTVEDLSHVPAIVRERRDRDYEARIAIESPVDRSFELSESEHIIGRRRQFPSSASMIDNKALLFRREYLTLRVSGPKAVIAERNNPSSAHEVPSGGEDLQLNADYDLYAGDFHFFLNLSATPIAAEAGG